MRVAGCRVIFLKDELISWPPALLKSSINLLYVLQKVGLHQVYDYLVLSQLRNQKNQELGHQNNTESDTILLEERLCLLFVNIFQLKFIYLLCGVSVCVCGHAHTWRSDNNSLH